MAYKRKLLFYDSATSMILLRTPHALQFSIVTRIRIPIRNYTSLDFAIARPAKVLVKSAQSILKVIGNV